MRSARKRDSRCVRSQKPPRTRRAFHLRELAFGSDGAHGARETAERGRLLGFAAATMFGEEHPASHAPTSVPAPRIAPIGNVDEPGSTVRASPTTRSFEFSGGLSSGLAGTASGVGASGGVRLRLTGPIWGRAFVSGRVGNIAPAQATTRNASFGGGLALALLPAGNRLALGLRVDAFANYFETIHFSEDDIVPDKRNRWLPGADVVAESGMRLVGSAGIFLGLGLEAVLGKTAIYTHQRQVAQVAPVRAVAELGFRVGF